MEYNPEEDLSREIFPLSHYATNRGRLINECFTILRGHKLESAIPPSLRGIDYTELKALCLEELKKIDTLRIVDIIEGRRSQSGPSTTNDTKQRKRHHNDSEPSVPISELKNKIKKVIAEDDDDSEEDDDEKEVSKKKVKNKQKKKKKAAKISNSNSNSPSTDNKASEKSGKVKLKKVKKTKKEKKLKKKLLKAKASGDGNEKDKLEKNNTNATSSNPAPSAVPAPISGGRTLMELLELEYRAKAIKALLKFQGFNSSNIDDVFNDNSSDNSTQQQQEQEKEKITPPSSTNDKPEIESSTNVGDGSSTNISDDNKKGNITSNNIEISKSDSQNQSQVKEKEEKENSSESTKKLTPTKTINSTVNHDNVMISNNNNSNNNENKTATTTTVTTESPQQKAVEEKVQEDKDEVSVKQKKKKEKKKLKDKIKVQIKEQESASVSPTELLTITKTIDNTKVKKKSKKKIKNSKNDTISSPLISKKKKKKKSKFKANDIQPLPDKKNSKTSNDISLESGLSPTKPKIKFSFEEKRSTENVAFVRRRHINAKLKESFDISNSEGEIDEDDAVNVVQAKPPSPTKSHSRSPSPIVFSNSSKLSNAKSSPSSILHSNRGGSRSSITSVELTNSNNNNNKGNKRLEGNKTLEEIKTNIDKQCEDISEDEDGELSMNSPINSFTFEHSGDSDTDNNNDKFNRRSKRRVSASQSPPLNNNNSNNASNDEDEEATNSDHDEHFLPQSPGISLSEAITEDEQDEEEEEEQEEEEINKSEVLDSKHSNQINNIVSDSRNTSQLNDNITKISPVKKEIEANSVRESKEHEDEEVSSMKKEQEEEKQPEIDKDNETLTTTSTSTEQISSAVVKKKSVFSNAAFLPNVDEELDYGDGTVEEITEYPDEATPITWYERWYSSKNVQKVVNSTKMMGKVRNKLKSTKKAKELKQAAESAAATSSVAEKPPDDDDKVPIIGSIQEYEKLFGKKVVNQMNIEVVPSTQSEPLNVNESSTDVNDKSPEPSDEDEEGDDLWGDILGTTSD